MQPFKLVRVRDYRNINHDDLLHDLYEQFCLSDFSTAMETAFDRYNNSIQSEIGKHAPAKLKRINNVSSCPWFAKNICHYVEKEKPEECSRNQTFLLTSLHFMIYENNVLITMYKNPQCRFETGRKFLNCSYKSCKTVKDHHD